MRNIPLPAPVGGATRLELLSDSFALELDAATGATLQPFKIDVVGNAGATAMAWDGLNDQGGPVASGSYTLQLVSNEGGRSSVVTSRSVTVIKGAETIEALSTALLGPNPLRAGQTPTLY